MLDNAVVYKTAHATGQQHSATCLMANRRALIWTAVGCEIILLRFSTKDKLANCVAASPLTPARTGTS